LVLLEVLLLAYIRSFCMQLPATTSQPPAAGYLPATAGALSVLLLQVSLLHIAYFLMLNV
jgi:hypothetical protein